MQESNIELHENTIILIEEYLAKNPLKTRKNEMVDFIYPSQNPNHALLSFNDLSNMDATNQNKAVPIIDYLRQVMLPSLKKEVQRENLNSSRLADNYKNLHEMILHKLKIIKKTINQLEVDAISEFVTKFGNGLLNDQSEFTKAFEEMVSEVANMENSNEKKLQEAEQIIKAGIENMSELCDVMNKKLKSLVGGVKSFEIFSFPKSIELVGQDIIHPGKSIPSINGIDIHPVNNIYVSGGCNNGDLVIINQDTNQEINRIKLGSYFNGKLQNCLWSPSGEKIMLSTKENPSIFICDDTGKNLLVFIERTYSKDGYGAVWLSDIEIAFGYEDGTIKFFNITNGIEICSIRLISNICLAMECFNNSQLLVGGVGSISCIDWKNNRIDWIKGGYHNNYIYCLKLNQKKNLLLSGSWDCFVKLMNIENQSNLWQFKLNDSVYGIAWAPGDLYVLALGLKNQLVALNASDGTKIIEFNKLSFQSVSLKFNPRKREILVGDNTGTGAIQKLKIEQTQQLQK